MGLVRVAFDGGDAACAALRWAITAARWHDWDVDALTVLPDAASDVEHEFHVPDHVASLRATVQRAEAEDTDVTVRSTIADGPVVQTLADAEPRADLIVVGSRGRGALAGLLGGSVSQRVVERAHGPVVVVGEDTPTGEVARLVVGVDGSGHATRALAWATSEARTRGAALEVVTTYRTVALAAGVPWVPDLAPAVLEDPRDVAQQVLERQLSRVDTRGVELSWSVLPGPAHDGLCARAADADLLVVGSRGLGGLGSVVFGSTGHRCLHESPTPVAVIP